MMFALTSPVHTRSVGLQDFHRKYPSQVRSGRALVPIRACAQTETPAAAEETSTKPSNVCATCGVSLESIPRGCDQKGRVAGGIGAVADWWPIKAYRPCPAFTQSGGSYTRKGQILDEMLFGQQKQKRSS